MDGSLIAARRTRHEVRDQDGTLVAVTDVISGDLALPGPTMIELAADMPGHAYRVRLFPAAEAIGKGRGTQSLIFDLDQCRGLSAQ